jgi:hypothetical protein
MAHGQWHSALDRGRAGKRYEGSLNPYRSNNSIVALFVRGKKGKSGAGSWMVGKDVAPGTS